MTIIRPVTTEDRPMLESWIAAEPDHANNTFEFYNESGTRSVVHGDNEGEVLVAKFTPCLRIDIEYSSTAGPRRIAKVMLKDLPEIEKQARNQGFKQLVFDSTSEKLIAFLERLGFTKSPDYRKQL